jgi:hypothetical protein
VQLDAGPVPDEFRLWMKEWDLPLPSNALIRFQVISRGPNPKNNYQWVLDEDRFWYLARHSGDTSDPDRPFDTVLPAKATSRLKRGTVRKIKRTLKKANLAEQAPYTLDRGVRGGGIYIVTARISGEVHQVIYDAAYPPLVEFLEEIIHSYE